MFQCVLEGRLWEWGHNQAVEVCPDEIVWSEREGAVRFASGAAAVQSFEHFLANGPWVSDVPPGLVAAVTAAVRAKLAAKSPE